MHLAELYIPRSALVLPASDRLMHNLQDGQTKCACLATASFCSSQDISSSKDEGNALILDGSRQPEDKRTILSFCRFRCIVKHVQSPIKVLKFKNNCRYTLHRLLGRW